MSEEMIIKHCSPTLAGIKTGSLFNCSCESEKNLLEDIRSLNRVLTKRGVRILPVKFFEKRALIYLYRPKKLARDLSDSNAEFLLQSCGYFSARADQCVVRLVKRLREASEFPHEIGLFLGYPAEDVKGFMENGGKHCKCTGYWKVYSSEDRARRLFEKYRKCTEIYTRRCAEGIPIHRLTVAG